MQEKKIDELRRSYPEVDRAYWFAIRAHRGQKRKDGVTPYIQHPIEVAELVSGMSNAGSVIVAALLHDVVEDTSFKLNDIARMFGIYVADLVGDETENKRKDKPASDTWRLRKEEAIEKIAGAGKEAKMISLADKLSNLRSMWKDYQVIGDDIWVRFNQKDKREQGWYYRSMRDQYIGLKATDAWKEYAQLIENLFGPDRVGALAAKEEIAASCRQCNGSQNQVLMAEKVAVTVEN
ncbi:MAG: bifunctional (p)ppGpp synthetase/guanosine-3',5'-bis(diphosphate) 3'-pyrophosphohydrolase [Firmicutes bacterium]|nr:bifunctional (p)ppGpp synthetase/guanosine-3',5'-bis(diphosphate) 3'-pyrophosphohydrolase [Bacillota bacterium]